MNIYELDTLSIQYIRRPVDNAARQELSSFFTAAYNEIYRRIMSDAYRIFTTESTALTNNTFSASSLSKTLLSIKSIHSQNGSKLLWKKCEEDNIFVHTSDNIVNITYYYMPPVLENPTPTAPPVSASPSNTPVIPVEYHNIFSLWAAYRYLHSRRRLEDANAYYEMAIDLFLKLDNSFGESVKLNFFGN